MDSNDGWAHSTRGPVATLRTVLPVAWLLAVCFATSCQSGPTPKTSPAAEPESVAAPPLRIVSYNIKHCRGMDGAVDLERIAGALRALEPDVVLLQEVDEECGRSGGVDQAVALGALLGMESRFASFMDYDGGRYGLAQLSRLPILRDERIALPDGTDEPRAALAITVSWGAESLRIVNAHLDWKADGSRRLAQARVLREQLAASHSVPSALSGSVDWTLLGGDLNDLPGSQALAAFETAPAPHFRRLGPEGNTFPSDAPTKVIDHFLVMPATAPLEARTQVIAEPLASDHCPVLLELSR